MKEESKIALIGMPGCGKSTIGKMLQEEMDLNLIDLDEYIVKLEEKTIDDLFSIGEDIFRTAETNALIRTSNLEGSFIVSTGGGIVKKEENIKILKDNFIVVFIDRSLESIYEDIDASTRPLLKNNKDALLNLYKERYDLYKAACHIQINNKFDINEVVKNIISEIKVYKGKKS